jgi:hypothetical protein
MKLISTEVEQGLMRVFCSDGDEPWGSCSDCVVLFNDAVIVITER